MKEIEIKEKNPGDLRILTWNLGLFSWAKYAHHFGIKLNHRKIENEYFQKSHLDFIVKTIYKIKPDICVLQEFYLEKDIELISDSLREILPHRATIDTWYHKHSILILSKEKITQQQISESEFYEFGTSKLSLIPIHLNSFSPSKRLLQINKLLEFTSRDNMKIDCIIGDTNFWCFKKNQYFLFKKDRKAYKKVLKSFVDATKDIHGTIKIFKLNFDKIFLANKLESSNAQCLKSNAPFMDHYPVFLDIKIKK